MIDLLQINNLLDEAACAGLRAELRVTAGGPARLLGEERPRPRVRRVRRLALGATVATDITALITAQKDALERHFAVALDRCEEPQFLRYETEDFFVAHQDGNTPLIHDDSRFRKISVVLFLSAQSEHPVPETYGGGALVLYGPYSGPPLRLPVNAPPGTLVAFRAETTHEVTPVTHGERFTIVSWFR
jgi:SM-20-related protein